MIDFLNSLGITPKKTDVYITALTHKSYSNENGGDHNERLEFLGDAVLELVVTEFLFSLFPDSPEGELTALRSAIVRKENLAFSAKKIKLGSQIRLSRGEKSAGGTEKDYILANTLESMIGAIFLDQGLEKAKHFIKVHISPTGRVEQIYNNQSHIGPKTAFQEFSQEKFSTTPSYQLLDEKGPDHNKIFVMGAFLKNTQVGTGSGSSKQKAESDAAENALQTISQEGFSL